MNHNHYRVAWLPPRGTRRQYGICYGTICNGGEGRLRPGNLWVDEVIRGTSLQIPEVDLIDFPLEAGWVSWDDPKMEGGDEFDHYVHDHYMKELKASEANGTRFDVGSMFVLPVGDGCAFYVIDKMGKRTLELGWRGYHPDRWVAPGFGHGGKFPVEIVHNMIPVRRSPW